MTEQVDIKEEAMKMKDKFDKEIEATKSLIKSVQEAMHSVGEYKMGKIDGVWGGKSLDSYMAMCLRFPLPSVVHHVTDAWVEEVRAVVDAHNEAVAKLSDSTEAKEAQAKEAQAKEAQAKEAQAKEAQAKSRNKR